MQTSSAEPVPHAEVYDSRPWLSQYPDDVPASISYPEQTIWDALEGIVARHGDEQAYVFQDHVLTYRQTRDYAKRFSSALSAAGVGKGDVVLLLLPNTPHFPVAYYAAARLGAAVAAIPPLSVEREIEYFIQDSGARVLVTIDLLFEKVAGVSQRHELNSIMVGSVTDFMPFWIRAVAPYSSKVPKPKVPVPYGERIHRFRRLLRAGKDVPPAEVEVDDVALLQYTGGTTGIPKAAMLTHRSLLVNAHQMVTWFPELQEGKETILAVLPFFHVYGVTLALNAGLLLAARIVLIAGGWQPTEIFEAIRKYRPSVFPGVPTLYVAIVNDKRSKSYDLKSIKACVSGGAPLPVEVKAEFERITGGRLLEGYGLTEASPLTHANPYKGRTQPGSIGLPVSSTYVRLVDAESRPVPLGDVGEMIVRGPQVMKGYWRRPEDTAATLRDGWLYTGDTARMDEEGWFYIVGRLKELIITGGENIYPREIEEVLFEHPLIQDVAVVGVPHSFGGEIAKAFVVLKEGATATRRDITAFAADRLAKPKVPRAVEFRSELPKSPAGKVLRRVLLEQELEKQKTQGKRGEPGD